MPQRIHAPTPQRLLGVSAFAAAASVQKQRIPERELLGTLTRIKLATRLGHHFGRVRVSQLSGKVPESVAGAAKPIQTRAAGALPGQQASNPDRSGYDFDQVEPTGDIPGRTQRVPSHLRQRMAKAFGHDFSSVRLESTRDTALGGADAETRGERIRWASNAPGIHTSEGRELLAHELTHVVQQRAGRTRGLTNASPGAAPDAQLEAEAEQSAARVEAGLPAPASIRSATVSASATPTIAQPGRGKKSRARRRRKQEREHSARPATERFAEELRRETPVARTTNRPPLAGRTTTVYRAEEDQYSRVFVQNGRVQLGAPKAGTGSNYAAHRARNLRQASLNRTGVRSLAAKGYDRDLIDDSEYAQIKTRQFLKAGTSDPRVRALFVGFDDPSRAVAFQRQTTREDPTKDVRIRSFQVPTAVAAELQRKSVVETEGRRQPTRPINVDVQHGRNQYGLRSRHIALLNRFAIPGSAREENVADLERRHGSGQSRYDEGERENLFTGGYRGTRRPYRPRSGGKGGRRGSGPVRAQFHGYDRARDPFEHEDIAPVDEEAARYLLRPRERRRITLADFLRR